MIHDMRVHAGRWVARRIPQQLCYRSQRLAAFRYRYIMASWTHAEIRRARERVLAARRRP